MLTFCSAFAEDGLYKLDPRCLFPTFTLKTAEGRKGDTYLHLRMWLEVTHMASAHVALAGSFHTSWRGGWKVSSLFVWPCALWKRRGDGHWRLTNRPDEQVWGENVGRLQSLAWVCREGCLCGAGGGPGNKKSGCSFSCDFTSSTLVLCVLCLLPI